jgi:ferredoxin
MQEKLDRRDFLKTSAQGLVVAGLAGAAQQLYVPAALAAAPRQNYSSANSIMGLIADFIQTSPANSLHNGTKEKAWEEALVGFSRGDDPLYELYKEKVGPFHWTPLEIFKLTYPDTPAKAEELTVISWILPQTESVKSELRKETRNPSEKWVRVRVYGEEFNEALRRQVAESLTKAGHPAVAPAIAPQYKMAQSETYGLCSTFSERHAAYAAGLGTFGLCDGLITAKGKAMRCGAVVARVRIPATPRPYNDHHAYCLYYAKGTCGMCAKRCPGGAITPQSGHNKNACMKQLAVTAEYADKQFGIKGYGCGFCQVATPCESRIPV